MPGATITSRTRSIAEHVATRLHDCANPAKIKEPIVGVVVQTLRGASENECACWPLGETVTLRTTIRLASPKLNSRQMPTSRLT